MEHPLRSFMLVVIAAFPISTIGLAALTFSSVVLSTVVSSGARADTGAPDAAPTDVVESSLEMFIERLASALEKRATAEKAPGAVRIEVSSSRSIDAAKVDKIFLARLKHRLKDGGILIPTSNANETGLRARITLSEEGSLVWATVSLEGGGLIAPAMVAISQPVDRELEASLGAVVKPAQTRFVLERLGAVPAGVLDAELIDTDGDGLDELVLLGVDGIRFFRMGASRLERVGSIVPLSRDKKWPRVPVGWLANLDSAGKGKRIWAVTSAGHSLILDAKGQKAEAGPADLVPLRGAAGPGGPLAGGWRLGSPVISMPLMTVAGAVVRAPALPPRIRDIAALPRQEGYILVDDQGQLLSQKRGEPPTTIATERVGDRIALADLDGDGELELLTTSSSAPGEPDHLVLRRMPADLSSLTVVLRSPLSGGSIVTAVIGRIDFGVRPDVVLIEEVGQEALAWRLRYAP